MNKPKKDDYIEKYGENYMEVFVGGNLSCQNEAFYRYTKDLEKYCSELEKENKDLRDNVLILKGVLINMQCDDFEKEVIEQGADEDDEMLEALIEKYGSVITAGIDLYLRGDKGCTEGQR